MGAFTGRSQATLRCKLPVEAAIAAWTDLGRQGRCQPVAELLEERGGDLRVVLPEERHGPARFKGEYVLRWSVEGRTVRCRSVGGNMEISSTAVFSPAPGGGCTIAYEETVSLDLGLNRILTKAVRPVAERLMSRGQAEYSRKMQAELDALG